MGLTKNIIRLYHTARENWHRIFLGLRGPFMIAVASLAFFMPRIFRHSIIDTDEDSVDTPLSIAIHSKYYVTALISSVTMASLMAFDLFTDWISGIPRNGYISLGIIISSLVIHDSLSLSIICPRGDARIFLSLKKWRDFSIGSALWLFLFHYGGSIWNRDLVSLLIIPSYFIWILFHVYSWTRLNASGYGYWLIISQISETIFFLSLGTNIFRYCRKLRLQKVWAVHEYVCVCYAFVFLVAPLVVMLSSFQSTSQSAFQSTTKNVTINEYIILFFVFTLSVFSSRLKEFHMSALSRRVLEMKQLFVRYVSHEIRSPLQILSVQLSILHHRVRSMHSTSAMRLKAFVDGTSHAASFSLDHSVQLIDEVTLDAMNSCQIACEILNELIVENHACDDSARIEKISHLVEDCTDTFRLLARAGGVSLELHYSSPAVEETLVTVRKTKMKQVIGNMISNAIKFSPRGSQVDISVSLVMTAPSLIESSSIFGNSSIAVSPTVKVVRISVKDQGAGISTENQARLFKGIVQFNANKLQSGGGSGIGLMMSYGVVNEHGGNMGVISEGEGRGSQFWIELPVFVDSSMSVERRLLSTLSSVRSIVTRRATFNIRNQLRVLLVDDVAAVRKVVSRMLNVEGVCEETEEAVDGEEAVFRISESILAGDPYDLVLMDFMMPRMDGPTATKLVRDVGFRGMVFGLTGNALIEDSNYFKRCGADEVIVKPVKIKELKTLIKTHIALRAPVLRVPLIGTRVPSVLTENSAVARSPNAFLSKLKAFAMNYPVAAFLSLLYPSAIFFMMLPIWDSWDSFVQMIYIDGQDTTVLISTLHSKYVLYELAFALSVAIYIVFELFLNYVGKVQRDGLITHIMIGGALLVHPVIMLVSVIEKDQGQVYWSLSAARDYTVIMSLYLFQYFYSGDLWNDWLLALIILGDTYRFTCRVYSNHITTPTLEWSLVQFLELCCTTVVRFWHIRKNYKRLYILPVRSSVDYCSMVYSVILVIPDIAGYTLYSFFGKKTAADTSVDYMIAYQYMAQSCCVLILVINTKASVFERAAGAAVLTNMRDLVRHVSHEIRTPLNIVSMGCQYLKANVLGDYDTALVAVEDILKQDEQLVDTMRQGALDLVDDIRHEVVNDVKDIVEAQTACSDAISVLNDLLTYEKLEANCLELDRSTFVITKLLEETIQEFTLPESAHQLAKPFLKPDSRLTTIYVNADQKKLAYAVQNMFNIALHLFPKTSSTYVSVYPISDGSASPRKDGTTSSGPMRRASIMTASYVRIKLGYISGNVAADGDGGGDKKVLRFDEVFLSTDEVSTAFNQTLQGNFESNLRLYVCNGIIKLHGGLFTVEAKDEDGKDDFAFYMDLPIEKHSGRYRQTQSGRFIEETLKSWKGQNFGRVAIDIHDEPAARSSDDNHSFGVESKNIIGAAAGEVVKMLGKTTHQVSGQSLYTTTGEIGQLKVLCVDDAATSVKMISRLLVANKVCDDPDIAGDGEAALAKIKQSMDNNEPYQLVLIDYQMPKMDGPTAVKLAREYGFRGVIFGLTGNGMQDEIDYFLSKGANKVIVKPVYIERLKRMIAESFFCSEGSLDVSNKSHGGESTASSPKLLPRNESSLLRSPREYFLASKSPRGSALSALSHHAESASNLAKNPQGSGAYKSPR